jgi:hypothetical protein
MLRLKKNPSLQSNVILVKACILKQHAESAINTVF